LKRERQEWLDDAIERRNAINAETEKERRLKVKERKERDERDQAREDKLRAEEKEKQKEKEKMMIEEEKATEVVAVDAVVADSEPATVEAKIDENMVVEEEEVAVRAESPVMSIKGVAAVIDEIEMDTTAGGDEAIEY
jgi:hypothetical protein